MTDPNSCYLSTRTATSSGKCSREGHGGARAHTKRTCAAWRWGRGIQSGSCAPIDMGAHAYKQWPRELIQTNVDSDPAIFKGHTSQDIIPSSFVLRDLCLRRQAHTHARTHTCTHRQRQASYGRKLFTQMRTAGVNVPSLRMCVSQQFMLRKTEMTFPPSSFFFNLPASRGHGRERWSCLFTTFAAIFPLLIRRRTDWHTFPWHKRGFMRLLVFKSR